MTESGRMNIFKTLDAYCGITFSHHNRNIFNHKTNMALGGFKKIMKLYFHLINHLQSRARAQASESHSLALNLSSPTAN